jgi:hypothetical protein
MRHSLSRRSMIACVVCAGAAAAGCRRGPAQERCPNCGMIVDRNSPFRAELVTPKGAVGYDSPRCALAGSRSGAPGTLRVQEFYTRRYVDGATLRFVGGSDVEGPMGAELVPVATDKVDKFMADHHGARVYRADDVTPSVLAKEGAP